jgi:hypothetical protein
MSPRALSILSLPLFSLLSACATDDSSPTKTGDSNSLGETGATEGDGEGSEGALARCTYTNPFSAASECKEYTGSGWTLAAAEADCAMPLPGAAAGTLEAGLSCSRDNTLGECWVDRGGPEENILVFSGSDPDSCSGAEIGCSFAGGEFVAGPVCEGGGGDGGGSTTGVFEPFEQVCMDPLDGVEGSSEGGQVCTWQAISACTEPGRNYEDYASCEPIYSQRPYWASSVEVEVDPEDPRLSDTAWQAEYQWVTDQVESCACVCCHTEALAPRGASGWYLEAEPIWVDTLDDDGLAMMAGWVDSTAFGAFNPEDNNGFDRSVTGMPTSDVLRMKAFLEGELDRRGLSRDDFADTPAFGGPLADQLSYEPEPCGSGQGVAEGGTIEWTGGAFRYLYILEQGSANPGVPPNLDLPEGTIWRIDVAHTDPALDGPVTYGVVPSGASQAFPVESSAEPLVSGRTYYLYVLRDIYVPLTRCLFTAP